MKWFMLLLVGVFAPPPICLFAPPSVSGTWIGATNGSGASTGLGGSCAGVTYSALTGENLVVLSVPSSATPGGTLTIDTCTGTSWDTELLVSGALMGSQCPTNGAAFTCAAANDDACGMQSRVSVPASPGSSYAVLVTGFGSSSGSYILTWNYGAAVLPSTGTSRSSTASPRTTPSNSFTMRPSGAPTSSESSSFTMMSTPTASHSMDETPSGTQSPASSESSSFTMASSPTASHSMDESPSSSPASTFSGTMTPVPSPTASQSMTETPASTFSGTITPASSASSSVTIMPSSSSSFTIAPSPSSSHSMLPSISNTRTGTSSASNTRSPSVSSSFRVQPISVGGTSKTDEANIFGYGSMGLAFGVIVTLVGVGAYYQANKRNKQRRSVHLSPQIYFNAPPEKDQPMTEINNASFRFSTSPKARKDFDPVPAA